MKKVKKWNLLNSTKILETTTTGDEYEQIKDLLLENRGLQTKEAKEAFLHPTLEQVTIQSVAIDPAQLKKAIQRIEEAIVKKEKIVVFGDYDVDGITGTAILWETLHAKGADVYPYIPHRIDEGYGLSVKGIENFLLQVPETKLIITVDNGIVANDAVAFANQKGLEVIITDHHTTGESLPGAFAIVHTTKLCGAAVAWLLTQELKEEQDTKHLDLVALATVADLVPLTGANRAMLTASLPFLQKTKRIGLQVLFTRAAIDPSHIGVYEIGHMIAPRLNAAGRLESAMDSLRLICTKDANRAELLVGQVDNTNKDRQLLTQAHALHAIEQMKVEQKKKLLFIANETYEEGIIGLIAGRLVEEYYRPAIVLSKGEKISKASARSIVGFNIIEAIRTQTNLLINAGGHPMAAGFTIETEKIALFQEAIEKLAEEKLTEEHLTRMLLIDLEIPLGIITKKLYEVLQELAPFGMANPEPLFVSKRVRVAEIFAMGKEKKHLKLKLACDDRNSSIDAVAFGMGELTSQIKQGTLIDVVYTVDENEWNGRKNLQLKVKDIQLEK